MKKILFTALLTISCFAAKAAETYHLTLDRSIEIAKDKSYNMKTLENSLEIARQNFKATMANYRTSLTFNATLPQYNSNVSENTRPITDDDGNVIGEETYFISRKSLLMSGNLRVNQPLPTDGQIYLRTGYSLTNDYNMDERSGIFNATIGLSQSLDALYGFNSTRASVKNARLNLESAEKNFKREELDLVYTISQSYYSLLQLQKSMEIAQLDLDRQKEAADISARKFSAGLIREVENLQMMVDLDNAESSYDQSVLRVYEQTNSFKRLLGLNSQDSIVLVSDLSYEIANIDPELAVQRALENRLEIREDEISVEQARLNLKQQKANGLPKTSLVAEISKVGTDKSDFSYGYGSSLSDMFTNLSDRPVNYSVGFTVSVPIIDWGKNKALVRTSEIRLEQSLLSQEQTERRIESEVRSLISSINSNLRRLQILEKSIVIAEKSFDITLQRFEDGEISSEDLASERSRLNSTNNSYLSAFINYQLSLLDLTRQTYYDFNTGQPVE